MADFYIETSKYVATTPGKDDDNLLAEAEALRTKGKDKEAFVKYQALAEMVADNPTVDKKVKSYLCFRMGSTSTDTETAAKYYKKALTFDSKNADAVFNLAALYQEERHLATAILMLKVTELNPKDEEAKDSYKSQRTILYGGQAIVPVIAMKPEEAAEEINFALDQLPPQVDMLPTLTTFIQWVFEDSRDGKFINEMVGKLNIPSEQRAMLLKSLE